MRVEGLKARGSALALLTVRTVDKEGRRSVAADVQEKRSFVTRVALGESGDGQYEGRFGPLPFADSLVLSSTHPRVVEGALLDLVKIPARVEDGIEYALPLKARGQAIDEIFKMQLHTARVELNVGARDASRRGAVVSSPRIDAYDTDSQK